MSEIMSRFVLIVLFAAMVCDTAFGQVAVRRDLSRVQSDAVLSDVSAASGDVTREVEHPWRLMRAVRIRERGNRPCAIAITPGRNVPEALQTVRDTQFWQADESQCGRGLNTSETWRVDLPEGADVIGMEACVNRSSGRLKGLRLHHNGGEFGGVASELQPNCRGNRGRWGDRVDCPAGHRATGLRVHYRQEPRGQSNPIVGLQLICRPG